MKDLGNKDVIARNIRYYLSKKGMTPKDLSRAINVPYSTVLSWVNAKFYPRIDKIDKMSDVFCCLKSDLIESHDQMDEAPAQPSAKPLPNVPNIRPVELRRFPLLGDVACGVPSYADQQHETFFEAGADIHADFCLVAKGDSMIGARIHDGDVVFIRAQEMVDNGEIAAVLIEDEATLKRVSYDREAGELRLFAENPLYKTLVYSGHELDRIRILGKAVAFSSRVR